jgi:MFS transporter, ACS family, D-galactonate transporter
MEAGSMRDNDRNHGWIVVVPLLTFMVIDFADKALIGIATVPIVQELEPGPRQFGSVGSSFFLLFVVSSVTTSFLVNRVPTRCVARFLKTAETTIPGDHHIHDDRGLR